MRGAHLHHSYGPMRGARVARRMMRRRRVGMMAAMGRGPWAEHHPDAHHGLSTDAMVRWLEEYQRDLEEEAADVASRIAELKTTPGTQDA